MSETKHTPGPWDFFDNRHGVGVVTNDKFRLTIADIMHGKELHERLANARLIACAPELLDVVEELVHLHMCVQEGLLSGMPTPEQWIAAIDKAGEVLAKAKGETR